MDRSAHRAQVARIVSHVAGGEVLLRWLGKGEAFPAVIRAERPTGTRATPDIGAQALEIVVLARDTRNAAGELVFAAKQPREGQHFTDAQGATYRIEDDRTTSHGAELVYACSVTR